MSPSRFASRSACVAVLDLDGHLAQRALATDLVGRDVADQPVVLGDRGREARERPLLVRHLHAIGEIDRHGRDRTLSAVSAVDVIDDFVSRLPGETRRLAHGEWGITLEAEHAGGWPLDVGIRVADELMRVQAYALAADERVNPWNFLHWNRATRIVRFACTRAGDIWVARGHPGVVGGRADARPRARPGGRGRGGGALRDGAGRGAAGRRGLGRARLSRPDSLQVLAVVGPVGPQPGGQAQVATASSGRPVLSSARPRQKCAKSFTGERSTTAANSSRAAAYLPARKYARPSASRIEVLSGSYERACSSGIAAAE